MKHARPDYDRIQDPWAKIPYAEPVFLIRGQDKSGPETLRCWAKINLANGGDKRASILAEQQAHAMEEWPMKKAADLPRIYQDSLHAENIALKVEIDNLKKQIQNLRDWEAK